MHCGAKWHTRDLAEHQDDQGSANVVLLFVDAVVTLLFVELSDLHNRQKGTDEGEEEQRND